MKLLKINKSNISLFIDNTQNLEIFSFPSLYVKIWNKRILTSKTSVPCWNGFLCKKRTPKIYIRDKQEVLVFYWQGCFEKIRNRKTNSDADLVPWYLRAWSFSFIIVYTGNATFSPFQSGVDLYAFRKTQPRIFPSHTKVWRVGGGGGCVLKSTIITADNSNGNSSLQFWPNLFPRVC